MSSLPSARLVLGRRPVRLAALLITTAFPLLACGSHSSPTVEPDERVEEELPDGVIRLATQSARFVRTEPAGQTQAPAVLRVPARVVFRDGAVAHVGAPVAGRVMEVLVAVGDVVHAGDPLLSIRSPDAAAARADLTATLAALNAARLEAERARNMLANGVGTERERVEAEARLAELEASAARARTTSSLLGGGQGATVTIRAPMAGTVLARAATAGAAVEPGGEPLVDLGDPEACWIEAQIFEQDLPLVEVGRTAEVDLPGRSAPSPGRVVRVGAVVRDQSRTAPARIEIDDTHGLRPGTFATARISVGEIGLTLPVASVVIREGSSYVVYVRRDGRSFERRPVEIGATLDGRVQILRGVRAGEPVVVQGALLIDGAADALL